MKRINLVICAAAIAVMAMFNSCTKEKVTSFNGITLVAEDFNVGGDKAYINSSRYACWSNNDQVKLYIVGGTNYNGSISLTYPNGSPKAQANADGFSPVAGQTVYAGFPLSLFSTCGVGFDGGAKNVELPGVYYYEKYPDGSQSITAPMVGQKTLIEYTEGSDNPNVLKMKNLCTLLKIHLDKPSTAFYVDSIVVVNTTNNGSKLSGPATITYPLNGDPSITMTGTYDRQSTGRVMLLFGTNGEAINANKDFYIPVPPLESGQQLKVYVHNALTGNWFSRGVSTTASVPGNSVANISGPNLYDEDANYEFHDYITNYKNGHLISNFAPIDLGVPPDNNSKLEMIFSPIVTTGSQYYSGSREIGQSAFFSISGPQGNSYFVCGFGVGHVFSDPMTRVSGHKYSHSMEVHEKSDSAGYYYASVTFTDLTTNGNPYTRNTTPSTLGGLSGAPNVYVFGYNEENRNPGMKLYAYKIWINGSLYRNFVPASNSDGTVGLYDMVDKEFIALPVGFELGDD